MHKKLLLPVHPGEILREEFMKSLLRLGRCFSTTPESWMNLQQRYELEGARREAGLAVEREVEALTLVR